MVATLLGMRVLVVEDEYLLAAELTKHLRAEGAEVIGPIGAVQAALDLVDNGEPISAAVLDIRVRGDAVYPLVDRLRARGVPVVFSTGYDRTTIPPNYADVELCEKPLDVAALRVALARAALSVSS